VPDTIEYTHSQLYKAGAFTSLFFLVPIGIMLNKRSFNKFNSFHSRILKLETRNAAGLAGFAFLTSMAYSARLMPLYYKGIMHIFHLEGFGQIRKIMKKKMSKMLEEDERLASLREPIAAAIE
jgi:hypothetical protein